MGSMGSMGLSGGNSALKFPSSSSGKMPTHTESSFDPSRVSSGGEDEPPAVKPGRRDSLSAEKALREVQKALSGVVEA
jgi:hypothetical protein